MDRIEAATLIADIVDSRLTPDRSLLHRQLRGALEIVGADRIFGWVQQPETTVGDEFQAVLPNLHSAVRATLVLRLTVLRECGVDTRFGIGWGQIEILEDAARPIRQDGPGWWSARRAIDDSKLVSGRKQYSFLRTRIDEAGRHLERGEAASLNAYVTVRDEIIHGMKKPARRYLLGLLNGVSQTDIAEQENVTQSNVSQTLASSGAHAIKRAEDELMVGERS